MKGPRGSLPRLFSDAAKIAESRLRGVSEYLDSVSSVSTPASMDGGGRLSRADFRALIANDPSFQEKMLALAPFATEAEKKRLKADIERVLPPEDYMPSSVTEIPPKPF